MVCVTVCVWGEGTAEGSQEESIGRGHGVGSAKELRCWCVKDYC